jgi:hypothetical protein
MPYFMVERQEIHTQSVKVLAADRKSARKMAAAGYGEELGESRRQTLLDNPRQMKLWEVCRVIPVTIIKNGKGDVEPEQVEVTCEEEQAVK